MPDDQEFDEEDLDDEETDEDEGEGEGDQIVKLSRKQIRALERKAKKVEKAEAEAKELRRERAFDKAGVKVDTKAGAFFAAKYDGDLDPEKIREEAEELGIPVDDRGPKGPELEDGEEKSTKERQELASDSKGDTGEDTKPDPIEAARKVGEDTIAQGKGEEDAMAAGLGVLAASVRDGDTRAGTPA